MMSELRDEMARNGDRLTIEIGDLREQIETCRNDDAWKELSFSAKIRVLIKAGIKTEMESEQQKQAN
jgi:hypothetical protein